MLAGCCLIGLTAVAGCGDSSGKATTAATTTNTTGANVPATKTSGLPAGNNTTTGQAPSSREPSVHEVLASSGALTATLHVGGELHHPRVGARWPISFTVTDAGAPARAEVAYEYLFGGAVVAHRSHYRFTGSFHDVFQWPASAVGYPLTFRAVITSSGRTLDLDYPVQVQG